MQYEYKDVHIMYGVWINQRPNQKYELALLNGNVVTAAFAGKLEKTCNMHVRGKKCHIFIFLLVADKTTNVTLIEKKPDQQSG